MTQDRNALGLSRRTSSDGFRYHIYLKSPKFTQTTSTEKVIRVAKQIADMTNAPREVYQWIDTQSHVASSLGFGFDSTESSLRVKFYVLEADHVSFLPEFVTKEDTKGVLSALIWRVGDKKCTKRVYVPATTSSLESNDAYNTFAQNTNAKIERVYEFQKNTWTPIKTGFHLKDRPELNEVSLHHLLKDLGKEDSSLFEWLRQTRDVAGPMHMFSVAVNDNTKEVTVYQMRSTIGLCVAPHDVASEVEQKKRVVESNILDKMTHRMHPEFLSKIYREKRLHVIPENTDAHSSEFLSFQNLAKLLSTMESMFYMSLFPSINMIEMFFFFF